MTEDNLSLWHSVEKTDPAHTKPITGKAYKGTSPRPQWLVQQATKAFGPCGIGWGYSIEDRIEEGSGGDKLHIATVEVWYMWNGQKGHVVHIGATPFSGKRKDGTPFLDEDAPKKSVTDALVKALSMLGFAGDIFMGRWDDAKYVASLAGEFAEHYPDEQESPDRYIQEMEVFIANCSDPVVLRKRWGDDGRMRQDILSADQRQALVQVATARLKALEGRA